MSIFKETFRNFVYDQLKIRELILKKGNKGDSRFAGLNTNYSPRQKYLSADDSEKTVTIDPGAFYINTTSKQCIIRMCSGVDLKPDEITTNTILEGGKFEKSGDLANEGLAIRYILEGGVPAKDADFKSQRNLSKGVNVIPRGRGEKGFGNNYGSVYGDPYLRADAKDGFGIVPMPGIVDADIRTKSAYGSLREAKVNFICHNRRQLEILELLYMRPGYPILLEWGWAPYINNKGRIENNFKGYMAKFFEKGTTIASINQEIVRRKRNTGGNYDGFLGFCKNFEIRSRKDGGYDCTTELIAMGEVLEGLKGKRTGQSLTDDNGNPQDVDDFHFILESLRQVSRTLNDDGEFKFLGASTDIVYDEEMEKRKGLGRLISLFNYYGVTNIEELKEGAGYSQDELKQMFADGEDSAVSGPSMGGGTQSFTRVSSQENSETSLIENEPGILGVYTDKNGSLYVSQIIGGQPIYFPLEGGQMNYAINRAKYDTQAKQLRGALSCGEDGKGVMIYENDKLTNKIEVEPRFMQWMFGDKEIVSESISDYIRWDFLVTILNKCVINPYQDQPQASGGPKTLSELTVFRDPISSQKQKGEYLNYGTYEFSAEAKKAYNTKFKGTPIKIQELMDASVDPSICLLPHQIPDVVNPLLADNKNPGADDRSIGMVFLNLEHLIQTYRSMRYNEEGINDDFSLLGFLKQIWEVDCNNACVNNKNFILQTEMERPNVVRVIDVQTSKLKDLKPQNLFELKIQSNESIVRDFNFNTTVPSSLSATIAVAAQAPRSISSLDQVTFAKFNKYTENRFAVDPQPIGKPSQKQQEAAEKKREQTAENYDKEVKAFKDSLAQLHAYRTWILYGKTREESDEGASVASLNIIKNIVKSVESKLISLQSKFSKDVVFEGKQYYKGEFRPYPSSSKSAVIPLKFNALLDGVGGLVIGNVFRIEKNKLPKGYQSDDIAFVILGEEQKITSGQDWTTNISGQLILLDLDEEKTEVPVEGDVEGGVGGQGGTDSYPVESPVSPTDEVSSEVSEETEQETALNETDNNVSDAKAKEVANEYAKAAFHYELTERFIGAGWTDTYWYQIREYDPADYQDKVREYYRFRDQRQRIQNGAIQKLNELAYQPDGSYNYDIPPAKDFNFKDYVHPTDGPYDPLVGKYNSTSDSFEKGDLDLALEDNKSWFRSYYGQQAQVESYKYNPILTNIKLNYSEDERKAGRKHFRDNAPIRVRDGSGNVVDVEYLIVTNDMATDQSIRIQEIYSSGFEAEIN